MFFANDPTIYRFANFRAVRRLPYPADSRNGAFNRSHGVRCHFASKGKFGTVARIANRTLHPGAPGQPDFKTLSMIRRRGNNRLTRAVGFLFGLLLAVVPVDASDTMASLLAELRAETPLLNQQVLRLALEATDCAEGRELAETSILTVIDYSLPSTEPRLWVLDLDQKQLLFRELVSHGVNTGENLATRFSNRVGSRQSSLGLFRTEGTYYGRNGFSLRLEGLERGINHKALERTIVMHGAWYVSEAFAQEHGRLGRSWGCPALEKDVAPEVIETIKNGSLLFIYHPEQQWQAQSEFLNGCRQSSSSPDRAVSTSASRR